MEKFFLVEFLVDGKEDNMKKIPRVDDLKIIYEDNHLLVVEKIENILSQADNTKDIDMLSLCKEYIKEKYKKPGNVYLGLVHRLDRPVGGVMVFAKTSKAASRLSDQIRTRVMKKKYLAIVNGKCKKCEELEDYLYKDKKKNMVYVVDKKHSEAKKCILSYLLKSYSNHYDYSLVEVDLKTGRPHQIRVQFSSRNHALFGDQRYSKVSEVGQQIALWSYSIEIVHPTTKEKMLFHSIPPKRFPWNIFEY